MHTDPPKARNNYDKFSRLNALVTSVCALDIPFVVTLCEEINFFRGASRLRLEMTHWLMSTQVMLRHNVLRRQVSDCVEIKFTARSS